MVLLVYSLVHRQRTFATVYVVYILKEWSNGLRQRVNPRTYNFYIRMYVYMFYGESIQGGIGVERNTLQ